MIPDHIRAIEGGAIRSGRQNGRNAETVELAAELFRALLSLGISREQADKAARQVVSGRGMR